MRLCRGVTQLKVKEEGQSVEATQGLFKQESEFFEFEMRLSRFGKASAKFRGICRIGKSKTRSLHPEP